MSSATFAATVSCDILLHGDGKRVGNLHVTPGGGFEPWTTPIAVIANGEGASLLLTGAVHGDEYEGPIALSTLIRRISPERIRGRIIVLPFLNMPALKAAQRRSPQDDLDLNRIFPGRPDGTPSQRLAHWICENLVPEVDAVLDCHTGGVNTSWIPLAMMHPLADPDLHRRTLEFLRSLRTPLAIVLNESDKGGMFDTHVENLGKPFVCCEFGGGMLMPATLEVARTAIDNALLHFGLKSGVPSDPVHSPWGPPRMVRMENLSDAVFCDMDGLYEPIEDIGTEVGAGQVVGLVHPFDLTSEPRAIAAPSDGLLFYRRARSRVSPGERLIMIAHPA